MALLDFPNSPSNGDTFLGGNGIQYTYNNGQWTSTAPVAGGVGATGATGIAGLNGATGVQGIAGATGTAGNNGATGTQGNAGATGSLGNIGATGTQGSQGAVGASGPGGADGATGVQGTAGATGSIGTQGNVGATGSQGPQGNSGAQGASGPQGAQGNVGDTGAQGISLVLIGSTDTVTTSTVGIGQPGQGWIGTSTGHVYFWNTLTTLWEDIGPIVGPQGNPGIQGTVGPQGATGVQGIQGASGLSGSDGATGVQGVAGATGGVGPQGGVGATGSVGSVGATGVQGSVGATGGVGPQGSVGATGAQGSAGATGAQGSAGATGSVGASGVGSAGATGSQGPAGGAANTANFTFTASQVSVSNNSDITVVTNANTWTFGSNGTLTLPASSPIIWSTSETSFINFNGAGPVGPGGDLILGTNGPTNVVIAVDDSSAETLKSWVFDTNGVLTLPGGNTRIGDVYGAGNDVIAGSTGTAVGVLTQGTGGYAALQWIGDTTTSTTDAAAVIVNSPFSASSGTVQIATGAVNGPVTDNIWEFGADGNLTAPGHLMPNADLAYDLGSTTTQWRSIYVGTGTIYIGGVALGVNQDNYVTVDGNPIITVNTAGNFTVQGDTNIVLGAVVISDTAPAATTPGSQWYNSVDGRTYVAYNGTWIDASPTIVPAPETYLGDIAIDGDTLNINGSTLTINTSGTLLVNGSEVTGSGGGGDRLTAGSYSVILGTDGMVTFPDFDGTKTLWGAVDEDFSIRTTRTDPGSDADIDIYAADDLRLYAEGDALELHANSNVLIYTDTANAGYQWTFGDNGLLTLPNGGVISEVGGAFGGAIRLEPSGASSSTQALVIYPTAGVDGNHIHLTAGYGGETDLYLGNDSQYVKVDHSGTIVIGTLGANTSTWTFGTDAVLTLPNGMTIDSYGTLGANATIDIGGDNTRIRIDDNGAPPGLYITTDAAGANYGWQFGPDGVLTLSTASTILGTGLDPNVYIETATTATTSTWTFGTDGILTLPAATPVIKGGGTGTDVTIIASTGSNTSTWTFAADGNLDLPAGGDITQNGNSVLYPKVDTVSTTSMTFITTGQTIIFADPTTANGNVDLYLPDNPPEGKTYIVKNISTGTTYVGTSGPTTYLETEFGLYSSGTYATINVANAAITWVFSNNGYRIINIFGLA